MGKYSVALRKLQSERLEQASVFRSDSYNDEPYDNGYGDGYIDGIEKAEEILFSLQTIQQDNSKKLWYKGSPNDLRPNNRGSYILIMKSHFNSNDDENPIKVGDIKIDSDFWDGEKWEHGYRISDDKWEVLYFAKLKWVAFPIPGDLGIKRSDDIFFN